MTEPVIVLAIEGDVVIRRDGKETVVVRRHEHGSNAGDIARGIAKALEEFGIPAHARVRYV